MIRTQIYGVNVAPGIYCPYPDLRVVQRPIIVPNNEHIISRKAVDELISHTFVNFFNPKQVEVLWLRPEWTRTNYVSRLQRSARLIQYSVVAYLSVSMAIVFPCDGNRIGLNNLDNFIFLSSTNSAADSSGGVRNKKEKERASSFLTSTHILNV